MKDEYIEEHHHKEDNLAHINDTEQNEYLGVALHTGDVLRKRDINGWYAYAVAAEPYSVVAISALLPIILESLSSNYGWQADNMSVRCDTKIADYVCNVKLGSLELDTSSFSLYCISISVLLQAIIFISMGALADHGARRKTYLLFFAFVGSICTILFAVIREPSLYWLAGVLTILSNIAFGASWVLYFAFIPTLTRDHPEVVEKRRQWAANEASWAEYHQTRDRISNTLSSHSLAIGYGSGVALLVVAAGIALALDQTVYSMQLGVALAGLWWFVFTLVVWKYLPAQPGVPLDQDVNLFFYSWKRVAKTLGQAKKLSQTLLFLLAWFILSDGYSTIISLAIFMGKKKFLMNNTELMIGAIMVPFSALLGTYGWLLIQRFFKLRSKTMVLLIASLYCLVPIYVLIGFTGKIGLVYKVEVWPVLIYFGLMLGAIQSYCRVLFAGLIPRGHESEFFSLYGITDKSSAWLGPLVTGAIIAHHDTRYGFIFPLVMMLIPVGLIAFIDTEKGVKDAENFVDDK